MKIKHHRDLLVWQKAMSLVTLIYSNTSGWPAEERYGLTSQLRKSAVSIPSNIAEGHGRRSKAELARFLNIAHGSLMELETQLQISANIGFLEQGQLSDLLMKTDEIGRMLFGLLSNFAHESKSAP